MKNIHLCFLLLLLFGGSAKSQDVQVHLYSAYVFDDYVDSYYDNSNYYKGRVEGSFQWGIGAEYKVNPFAGIELSYIRQDTKAPMTYYRNGIKNTNFDLAANYIMIGSNRYISKPNTRLEGYGGAMVGMGIMHLKNPDNGNSGNKAKLAWGVKIGGHFWATPSFGIKLQAQLLSAVQSVGGGFYFGSGGSGGGISTYSSIFQFGLGGGLVFRIPTQATAGKSVNTNQ